MMVTKPFSASAYPHEMDAVLWCTHDKQDFAHLGSRMENGKRIKAMIYFPDPSQAEQDLLESTWVGELLDKEEITVGCHGRFISALAEPHFQWFLTDEEEAHCISSVLGHRKKGRIRRADREERRGKAPRYHIDFDHYFDYQIRYVYGFDSGTFLLLGLSDAVIKENYNNLRPLVNEYPENVFRVPPGAVLGIYFEGGFYNFPVYERLVHSQPYDLSAEQNMPSRNVAITEVAHPRCFKLLR